MADIDPIAPPVPPLPAPVGRRIAPGTERHPRQRPPRHEPDRARTPPKEHPTDHVDEYI